MGEANMCQTKWNEDGYVYKNVYNVLKSTLERNDIRINEIGTKYTADHAQQNNHILHSSLKQLLDHLMQIWQLSSFLDTLSLFWSQPLLKLTI